MNPGLVLLIKSEVSSEVSALGNGDRGQSGQVHKSSNLSLTSSPYRVHLTGTDQLLLVTVSPTVWRLVNVSVGSAWTKLSASLHGEPQFLSLMEDLA